MNWLQKISLNMISMTILLSLHTHEANPQNNRENACINYSCYARKAEMVQDTLKAREERKKSSSLLHTS